ncbi:MAG: restriction endonuclease [Robiginitomaculum sp.]|nr:MAG: restriction endonuclease [Robiginitomaculum sp.]
MAFGVFIHKVDSKYDDSPTEQYQFPKSYLKRAQACIASWIVYYEPTKVKNSKGYFAIAKIKNIIPDPKAENMYVALVEEGSYLEFPNKVPFKIHGELIERGLLNELGKISGRAQSSVRPISIEDFNRILDMGLENDEALLPRIEDNMDRSEVHEDEAVFMHENSRDRISYIGSRIVRDRFFRKNVLSAYDERCAITGLKLINGGGRAEVEAAHIKPVHMNGPDSIQNGIALSGTVHWMFDRGLIGLSDDMEVLISRHVNDRESIEGLIRPDGFALTPNDHRLAPHPVFLKWHRDNCFKQ